MISENQRSKIRSVLSTMVEGMARHPEEIRIDMENDEMGIKMTINANKSDYGAIIGREGNTIKAIRTIMRSVGASVEARLGIMMADDHRDREAVKPSSIQKNLLHKDLLDEEL